MPPPVASAPDSADTAEAKAQYDDVVRMYNSINNLTKVMEGYRDMFRSIKEENERKIEAILNPNMRQVVTKIDHPRSDALATLVSLNQAQLLVLEDFETTFRKEWKLKKKQSVVERRIYLDSRDREVKRLNAGYWAEVYKMADIAGVKLLEDKVNESGATTSDETASADNAMGDDALVNAGSDAVDQDDDSIEQ
jgi:hypothetical protein